MTPLVTVPDLRFSGLTQILLGHYIREAHVRQQHCHVFIRVLTDAVNSGYLIDAPTARKNIDIAGDGQEIPCDTVIPFYSSNPFDKDRILRRSIITTKVTWKLDRHYKLFFLKSSLSWGNCLWGFIFVVLSLISCRNRHHNIGQNCPFDFCDLK